MADPAISVVIPTKNRDERLARALDGLARQALPRQRFEVIVVRGAPPEGPAEAPVGLPVRVLESYGSPGAATQRNVGWRAARAPLVAFMDDDCRPSPQWLQELLRAADGSMTILQGRTEPDPEESRRGYGLYRTLRVTGLSPWFETANIAYPRELLELLGGFDEAFPFAWGEDTDLGIRAVEAVAGRRFVPEALVWHAVHRRSFAEAAREAVQRDSLPALIARHPSQRRALDAWIFARRAHTLLAVAVAGAIAFRRRRALALASAAPYLARHRNRDRGPILGMGRALAELPLRLPVDVLEILALARSSVRNRCLVL